MLSLVDSFSDKWLAFLWEQTVPHYWLTFFSIPMRMSFYINSLRRAKKSLLGSSVYHIITWMVLSLSIIKDLRTTVPLVFYIRNSLRFWYYASLSTCCKNLKKSWGHQENLGKVGVKLLTGLTEKSVNFSTSATSNIRLLLVFGEEDQ